MVENMDWEEGVTLTTLVDWINAVVAMYRPKNLDSRSSPNFTPRSFRHYQTLGCIDSPERVGKQAMYGFRHYLQALLVRKLLWEKVSAGQIVTLLEGKSNEDCKALLFQGIAIVPGGDSSGSPSRSEQWSRIHLAEGIELHLQESSVSQLSKADIKRAIQAVEKALRERASSK